MCSLLTPFFDSNEEHNFVAMFHNSDEGANNPEGELDEYLLDPSSI